jgi:hypothetical protein
VPDAEPHYLRLPPPTPESTPIGPNAAGWNSLAIAAVIAMVLAGVVGAVALGPAALVSIHRRGGKGRSWVIGLMVLYLGLGALAGVLILIGLQAPR